MARRDQQNGEFICPECGSREKAGEIEVSSFYQRGNPWSGVLQKDICADCGEFIPAHLAQRWSNRSLEEAKDEWEHIYRGTKNLDHAPISKKPSQGDWWLRGLRSRKDLLNGSTAPAEILAEQAVVKIKHLSFDQQIYYGQIIVHHDLADETAEIFEEILAAQFPLQYVTSPAILHWSDDASMAANNSSGFNYRPIVGGGRLSYHATGRAIDINPLQNPYCKGDLILPPNAIYDPKKPGTLLENGPVVAAFERRGWEWGGRWESFKDWHHFQKPA